MAIYLTHCDRRQAGSYRWIESDMRYCSGIRVYLTH